VFTGLIEEVGSLRSATPVGDSVRLAVAARVCREGLRLGDSIAINGVCQTVVGLDDSGFAVQAIATTLSRTTLGRLLPGAELNLERALALGDRLGGHLVQGHVDAVGTVLDVVPREAHVLLDVELPAIVAEASVLHGSIAIEGVSLTINALDGARAQVALIPHTWQHTNLRRFAAGDAVNLEADMIGKYVTAYLKRTAAGGR
jgi:riboflavin synthase